MLKKRHLLICCRQVSLTRQRLQGLPSRMQLQLQRLCSPQALWLLTFQKKKKRPKCRWVAAAWKECTKRQNKEHRPVLSEAEGIQNTDKVIERKRGFSRFLFVFYCKNVFLGFMV